MFETNKQISIHTVISIVSAGIYIYKYIENKLESFWYMEHTITYQKTPRVQVQFHMK